MILSPLVRKLLADLKVASTDDNSDNPYRLNASLVILLYVFESRCKLFNINAL